MLSPATASVGAGGRVHVLYRREGTDREGRPGVGLAFCIAMGAIHTTIQTGKR